MPNLYEVERRVTQFSNDAWLRRSKRGDNLPPLLYFKKKPEGFEASGLYICFQDFRDLRKGFDVSVTTAYHALVYYFSMSHQDLYVLARHQLYHNPSNRASWNKASYTDRYFLHGSTMMPYSMENPDDEHRIPGFAKFGREILRSTLFDDEHMPEEPTDYQIFGGPVNLTAHED